MIVAPSRFDESTLQYILQAEQISAVVLGDPVCQEAMFPHGILDIPLYASRLISRGKGVYLCTPVHVTSRVLDVWLNLITLLLESGGLDGVIVHDVGLARWVHEQDPGTRLIWGALAQVRGGNMNTATVDVLADAGVSEIQDFERTADTQLAEHVRRRGIRLLRSSRDFSVVTLSRTCLELHFRGGESCRRQCQGSSGELRASGGEDSGYRVRGHFLVQEQERPAGEVDLVYVDEIGTESTVV